MSIANIVKLNEIANKPSRLIIGLMSGTSLDGLDVALCRITGSGETVNVELIEFDTCAYEPTFRNDILEVFSRKEVSLQKLCIMNAQIATVHASMILSALEKWKLQPADIDCIASHGQTVYHAPRRFHRMPGYPDATLQIGDGDHLAVITGILTLSDFRQKHVAAGGEGAPLAVYADELLFSSANKDRFLLNIGGIANFTWLPARQRGQNSLSTDTGPGNTLINAAVRGHFGKDYDENGTIAAGAKVCWSVLDSLMQHSFFRESFPKTTGPEDFNADFVKEAVMQSGITQLSPAALVATLTRFTAESIALAMRSISNTGDVYVSGGGVHNATLMKHLQELLPGMLLSGFESLGISPDAKEALLFALLANETLAGKGLRVGNHERVSLGKISFPI